MSQPNLLSISQAARELGLSEDTVRKLCDDEVLTHTKHPKFGRLIDAKSVEAERKRREE